MDIRIDIDRISDKLLKHIKLNDCLIKRICISKSKDSKYIECKHINVDKVIKIRISNHKNVCRYDKRRYLLIDINPHCLNLNNAKIAINNLIKD